MHFHSNYIIIENLISGGAEAEILFNECKNTWSGNKKFQI